MPTELLETANEHLVPSRRLRVIGVDVDPACDSIERAREFRALKVRQVVFLRPLPAHGFRCRETRRVIDHGAAAERRSLQHDQPEIARGQQAAGIVHRLERVALLVREVRLVAVPALLQHEDVLAGGGELSRDDATARAGADDDYVAAQRAVRRNGHGADRFGCGRGKSKRTGISDGACGTGRRVMRHGR